jgi:hypothetical protein
VDDALSHVLAVVFALLAAMCAAVGMVVRQRAIQDQARRESSDDVLVTRPASVGADHARR